MTKINPIPFILTFGLTVGLGLIFGSTVAGITLIICVILVAIASFIPD